MPSPEKPTASPGAAFEIRVQEDREATRIVLRGRFDAAQVAAAKRAVAAVTGHAVVDFAQLDYIASAGIGVLFALHARLRKAGGGLRFVHLKPMIWEIFRIADFHKFIEIEPPREP